MPRQENLADTWSRVAVVCGAGTFGRNHGAPKGLSGVQRVPKCSHCGGLMRPVSTSPLRH